MRSNTPTPSEGPAPEAEGRSVRKVEAGAVPGWLTTLSGACAKTTSGPAATRTAMLARIYFRKRTGGIGMSAISILKPWRFFVKQRIDLGDDRRCPGGLGEDRQPQRHELRSGL